MQHNPKDPLNKSPDAQRELFNRLTANANGFTAEQVAGAAANLIVNAIRQAHPSQKAAIVALDELSAHARNLLANHYDGMGRRRNIFPFHQVIEAPMLDVRPKFGNGKAS